MNTRTILAIAIVTSIACFSTPVFAEAHPAPTVSAATALTKLKAGNKRFSAHKVTSGKAVAKRRTETAQAQHPFAVVIACADSRTCPELLFDQNIGDLFVIRTAGNLVDEHGLGSIEYAVEHLGTRLVVVLGHERCGAVQAALASETAHGHVNSLVRDIQPAVKAARELPGDKIANTVCENARRATRTIRKEGEFGEAAGQVKVITAIYDLDTGVVDWLKE
jgi:carbonic anhydrase